MAVKETNVEPRETGRYAGVFLLDIPFAVDRMYDYSIPSDLRNLVYPGVFVVVPFGGGNRHRAAIVAELHEKTDAKHTKPILSVSSETVPLNAEQLSICRWLAAQTVCTVGDAVHAITPAGAAKNLTMYQPSGKELPPDGAGLTPGAIMVFEYIKYRGLVRKETVVAKFGARVEESLGQLLSEGFILTETGIADSGLKYEKVCSLSINEDELQRVVYGERIGAMKRRLSLPSQLEALKRLFCVKEMTEAELLSEVNGLTKQQLSTLISNGLVKVDRREVYRNQPNDVCGEVKPLVPNETQSKALQELKTLVSDEKPHAALLYGVTGSGKTTVILGMIDEITAKGRGVIVLLPEIALTPQMLAVFYSRYGKRVAVMHSGLSGGERFDAYVRARDGLADIVVGTRSAVFAPVKDLGMIVIDEEQEHTYKSDMTPKYHARDVARKRCADNSALLLLSSATPSVESFKKASEGVYKLVKLEGRYGAAGLPNVKIVDMRSEAYGGNATPLSDELSRSLLEENAKGNQSILFLNRRGYNTFISCVDCGSAVKCPSCSVAMTYHTKKGSYEAGDLVCHWCGRRIKLPETCPECNSKHLIRCGYGTQRVEQEISALMPDANIMRMDADTTAQKHAYDKLLNSFREEGDVLLGTQMVTKGHDFPRVTLVGVLLADMSLYLDDFRANERTFALLTQVIGRAGRADRTGTAIIQTNNPDNDIIKFACDQDYETFFKHEIALRKLLTFPPFCDIALLQVSHTSENELFTATQQLAKTVKTLLNESYKDVPQILFGPFEAPMYKIDDRYRMRFILKCRLNNRSREFFFEVMRSFGTSFSGQNKPQLSIDFNPTNL